MDRHIEITQGVAGGKPRIADHRITVQNIVIWHEWMGLSADEIAAEYGITLSDVYAALAYYYDHRTEIDESIQADEAFAVLSDGSNVPQINHGDIASVVLPLPPLAEQERIAAEVERRLSVGAGDWREKEENAADAVADDVGANRHGSRKLTRFYHETRRCLCSSYSLH